MLEGTGSSGTLPASIAQLSALTYLSPGALYGTLPDSLSQLTGLQVIRFGGQYYYVSKLSGSLPPLSGMTDLRFLDISGNTLSGTLPPDMFVGMSRLEYVDFHGGNQFTGSLPPSLLNLPAVKVVDVSGNSFTGALPATNAPALQYLNMRDNSFSGTLPQGFLTGITQVSGLYLGNNQLEGTLPDFSVLTSLSSVSPSSSSSITLDSTGLSDVAASAGAGVYKALAYVQLGGSNQISLPMLDLSRNNFVGNVNIARLPYGGVKSSTFQGTDLSNNQLSANGYVPGSALYNVAALHPQVGFGVTGTTVTVSTVADLQRALSLRFSNSTGYFFSTVNRAITTIVLTASLTLTSALVVGANPFADSIGAASLQASYPNAIPFGTVTQHGVGYPMQTTFVGLFPPTYDNGGNGATTVGCTEPTTEVPTSSPGYFSLQSPCLISPSRSVTIVGACDPGPCQLDAQGLHRHFEVYNSGLRLQNLELVNGQGPTDYSGNYLQYQIGGAYDILTLWGGGAVFADGGSVVELNNCTLSGNVAHPPGGGAIASLAMHPLSVTVTSSSLTYNLAYGSSGGAIYTRGGVVLSNVSFASNQATYGGAVYAVLGVNATNCAFSQNGALLTGGAVVVPALSATDTGLVAYYRPALIDRWLPPRVQPDSAFSATSFTANSCSGAGGQGGAVYAPTGTSVGLTRCTFAFNSANLAGGALYGDGVTDVGSSFYANLIMNNGVPDACSSAGGGALAVVGTRGLSLSGTVFDSNQGKTQGGAILATYQSPYSDFVEVANAVYVTAVLNDVVLTNNIVTTGGGGAMVLSNLAASLSNVTCANNSASNSGVGGCLNALQLGGLSIGRGSVFSGNGAGSGGAVGISCGIPCAGTAYACGSGGFTFKPSIVVKISQTAFSLNGATSQGGALYVRGGGLVLNQTSFVGNFVQGLVAQGGGLFMAEYWASGAAFALAPAGLSLVNASFVRNMALVTSSYSSPTELFSQVSAPGSGGAMMFSSTVNAAPLTATAGTTWIGNYANTAGAAYINGRTVLTLNNASFSSNAATGTAGALLLTMPASLPSTMLATFSNVAFIFNSAQLGGAVALYSSVAVAASGCTWSNNSAINGGAFFLSVADGACSVALTGTSTIGNTASASGGLYYTDATDPASAPNVSCTGTCTSNTALNGPNSLVAVPVRHVCSLNGSVTSIKSGRAVPAFNVSLYDGLGQLVASAPDVVVTITSTSSGMAGTTAAPYTGGAATFQSLIFTDMPGTAIVLTWHVSSTSLDSVNGQTGSAQVVIAPCDALEVLDTTQLKCVCQAGTVLSVLATATVVTYSCQLCPAGQHAPYSGSSSCTINTPGYYSSDSRDQQLPCPVGTYLDGTALACRACQPGSYTSMEGQTTCQVNPAGTVSSPQTTQSCSLALAGVSASSLGDAQKVALASSIAAALNVTTSAVAVLAVADVAARRRLSTTKAQVNFTVVATGTAKTAAVSSSLNATTAFTQALAASLSQSGDPVLRVLTPAAITASAPRATTVYLQAEPCPPGTYLNGINQTCDACAVGTVAPAASSITCTVCAARTAWLDATRDCQPCPDNAVTSPNSPTQCACSVGYYDTLFGASVASPVCAPCPLGGVCETGFLAADADWWRASTVSDVLYKCKVGSCLSESVSGPLTGGSAVGPPLRDDIAPTNCVDGNTGPLCALCLDGYALQSGQCLPCPPGDAFAAWSAGAKTALVLLCLLAGLLFVALAFFQPLSPSLEAKWGTFTGAVSSTFGKAAALPQRAVQRCVPGLSAKAQSDSPEHDLPKAALLSSRLKGAHAVADAEPEVPLHADSMEVTHSVRVTGAIHTLLQVDEDCTFDTAAQSGRHSTGGVLEADAVPQDEHPLQSTRPSTTGAEATAAVRAAQHSSAAAMVASMEDEAMAMAASASRRLVDLIGEELTGDGNVGGDDSEESEEDYSGATGEALELLEKLQRLIEKAQKCVLLRACRPLRF